MNLILWRHAEAVDSYPDMERALTAKGHQQAEKMAAWLKPRLPTNTRILVSPARRTLQTANALGMDFNTLDALAPGASVAALLQAAGWPHHDGTVLIVGHQPTLGMAAAFAITGQDDCWSVKKSAVWWICHRTREGKLQTMLRAVMSPEQL